MAETPSRATPASPLVYIDADDNKRQAQLTTQSRSEIDRMVMRRFWPVMMVCLTSSMACEAIASPATTTWTTYLYEGPGKHYSVVDEVPQATRIDDAKCASEWCKVILGDRVGYVMAEVVAFGNPAKPAAGVLPQPASALNPLPPKGPCFLANQTSGNGGKAMTIFCTKTP